MKASRCLAMLAVVAVGASAEAGTLTFLGQDTGLGEATRLASHPNSDTARTNFFANLVGVGTETFESETNGAGAPLAITFAGNGVIATLTGTGNVANVPTGTQGNGRYPISGNQYWESGGSFGISFSSAVSAFGFYGIDIGDFDGQVTLTLAGGGVKVVNVGNSTSVAGGGVLYFGVIETSAADAFTSITFGNTQAGNDFFGFDDFSVGTLQQVSVVPLPKASLAGLGLLGALSVLRLRRRRTA